MKEIAKLRKTFDRLDVRIVGLLAERARVSLRLRALKRKLGVKIHDPQRERAILARVIRLNRGLYPASSLKRIYQEIMRASKVLQRRGRR